MGALLVSGVQAPVGASEIPAGGIGLDDLKLNPDDSRLHQARMILHKFRTWDEVEAVDRVEMTPSEFIRWCDDSDVETEWIKLIKDLYGIYDSSKPDLTAARLAAFMSR